MADSDAEWYFEAWRKIYHNITAKKLLFKHAADTMESNVASVFS